MGEQNNTTDWGGFANKGHPATALPNIKAKLTNLDQNFKSLSDKEWKEQEYKNIDKLEVVLNSVEIDSKKTSLYVMAIMDYLTDISGIQASLSKWLQDKLQKEYTPYLVTVDEATLKMLEKKAKLEKRYADCAKRLQEMVEFDLKITDNCSKVAAAAAKAAEEAEAARLALAAARKRAKEEEEEKKREKQRKREEEERLRKEEEERKRLEAEEEERLRKEEEERQRQIREEEDRKEKEERERIEREEQERIRQEEEARRAAEEEERLRREQEEREAEAERLRLEEELLRQQREEEARQRFLNDPSNWPVYEYNISADEDVLQSGFGCAVRAKRGDLGQEQVQVNLLDPLKVSLTLDSTDEILGNIMMITLLEEHEGQFEPPLHISVPYLEADISGSQNRELIMKVNFGDNTWVNIKCDQFEMEGRQSKLADVSIESFRRLMVVVVSSVRTEHAKTTPGGCKITSRVDSRIVMKIPENAYTEEEDFSMKVIPIDSQFVGMLRAHSAECQSLVGTSNLVHLRPFSQPAHPVELSVPQPSGAQKKKQTGRVRSSQTQPWTDDRARPDSVYIMKKNTHGRWTQEKAGDSFLQNDITVSELTEVPERYILLRVNADVTSPQVVQVVNELEKALAGRLLRIVAKQRQENMGEMFTDCCKPEKVDGLVKELDGKGFSHGPEPSGNIMLKEGSKVEVSLIGNLTFDEIDKVRFSYRANIGTSTQFFIKPVDEFGQKSFDHHRGYLRFHLLVDGPRSPRSNDDNIDEGIAMGSDERLDKGELLCQLAVTLPKTASSWKVKRTRVQVRPSGPITEEYLQELANRLGGDWVNLAECLGLPRGSIQAIQVNQQTDDGDVHNAQQKTPGMTMLIQWYKTTKTSSDKVLQLHEALMNIGRVDLAKDLLDRNKEYVKQSEKRKKDEEMDAVYLESTKSLQVRDEWQKLGSKLGIDQQILNQISQENSALYETCLAMFREWGKANETSATPRLLVQKLDRYGYKEAARSVRKLVNK